MTKKEFLKIAETEETFDEDFVYSEPKRTDDIFEDDGAVHVRRSGVRIAFYFGQDKTPRFLDRQTTRLAKRFGFQLK